MDTATTTKVRLAIAPDRRTGLDSGPRGTWTSTTKGLVHARDELGSTTLCGRPVGPTWLRPSAPADRITCAACADAIRYTTTTEDPTMLTSPEPTTTRVAPGYYEATTGDGLRYVIRRLDAEQAPGWAGWWRVNTADEDGFPAAWCDDYPTLRDALASL